MREFFYYQPFNYRPKGGLTKKMKKLVLTGYWGLTNKVNPQAEEVIKSFKGKLTEELYTRIEESLLGWDEELQVVIAANIRDAVYYGWERYTYVLYLDEMLNSIYLAIDKEKARI